MEKYTPIIQIVANCLLILVLIASYGQTRKMFKSLEKVTLHLYQLSDALHMGLQDPIAREVYASLRKEGPFGDITRDKREKMVDAAMAKEQERLKQEIGKQMKKSNDPEEISRMERSLTEIDNIFTLTRTLGPDSSKEYQETVQKEIEASKKRIFGID